MTANLLSTLQGLTAPDREVDALIALHVGLPQEFFGPDFGTDRVDGPSCFEDHDSWAGGGRTYTAPYFTSSLDATVALCERVLPGYDWIVGHTNGGLTIYAQVGQNEMVFGETPAIALLIAILTALETRDAE